MAELSLIEVLALADINEVSAEREAGRPVARYVEPGLFAAVLYLYESDGEEEEQLLATAVWQGERWDKSDSINAMTDWSRPPADWGEQWDSGFTVSGPDYELRTGTLAAGSRIATLGGVSREIALADSVDGAFILRTR